MQQQGDIPILYKVYIVKINHIISHFLDYRICSNIKSGLLITAIHSPPSKKTTYGFFTDVESVLWVVCVVFPQLQECQLAPTTLISLVPPTIAFNSTGASSSIGRTSLKLSFFSIVCFLSLKILLMF